MKDVEWGEYKLEDLFEKVDLQKLNPKDSRDFRTREITKTNIIPAVVAKVGNNGVMYYVSNDDYEITNNKLVVISDGAVASGLVYYHKDNFTVLHNAYVLKLKQDIFERENIYLFLKSSLEKSIFYKFNYEYKPTWNKVKEELIQLPTKNDEIDFEFMEEFIEKLEQEKISKLEKYLEENKLQNYELSKDEEKVLDNFRNNNIEFREFKVIEIFDVKNTKNILSRDIVLNSGKTPYLCASTENNAISSYILYDEKYLDKGDCIFIGGKTFVVTYQKQDFYSNDSHNLALYMKDDNKNRLSQLFLVTCVNKGLNHKYSWGNSISNKKIQDDKILLPVCEGNPDYKTMEILISAIKKLIIKDVVLYSKVKLYKKCVK